MSDQSSMVCRPDHPAVIATEGRVLLSVASQSQAVPADLIPCFAKWTARLIDLQATGNHDFNVSL